MELASLALEVTQRVVIHDGVAGHIIQCFVAGDTVGALADDDRQFSLIIQLPCAIFGNEDIIIGAGEGIGELDEQGGMFGEFASHLANVLGVIEPHADDFAGSWYDSLQVGVVEDYGLAGKLGGFAPIFAAQQLADIFIIQFNTHVIAVDADSGSSKASA